jgi:AcrR family transcriptional regulator
LTEIHRPSYISDVATQGERRAETRRRLLDAAAELFAERGVDGASIDAIAERADRTSGALYDHFGGKDGLLFALLEGWTEDVSAVIGAELETATTLDERLGVLWRNVSSPVAGDGRWIALEHELWTYAARHEEARDHLARRYRAAWRGIAAAATEWTGEPGEVGPPVIGLLLGLEMMRRIDPDAVPDDLAIGALRGVVAGTSQRAASA